MSKPNIETMYHLTPMQEGILFHDLYAPESRAYFQQISRDLEDVNPEHLKSACEVLVQRHAVLRSLIVWKKRDKAIQIVRRRVELPWQYLDFGNLDESEQGRAVAAFEQEDRAKGFELDKAPLVRVSLCRLSVNRFRFYWSSHHILLDGWSLDLLLTELMKIYAHLERGVPFESPAPRPFRDFVAWISKQDRATTEDYWRSYLSGLEKTPALPGDLGTGRGEGPLPKALGFSLDASTQHDLSMLARRHQLTPAILVQGLFALLLARYSGQEPFVYGHVLNGRPATLQGSDEMVGLFINTLPIRVPSEGDNALFAWLESYQNQLMEITHHAYFPLVDIQQLSQIPVSQAFFETMIAFAPQAGRVLVAPEDGVCSVEPELLEYPLALVADSANCSIHFHSDRVDEGLAETLITRFRTFLIELSQKGELGWDQIKTAVQADLAPWQERDASSGKKASALEGNLDPIYRESFNYWQKQLAQTPEFLDFPLQKPRPKSPSDNYASLPFLFRGESLKALRKATEVAGCNVFEGLLAGFAHLLSRYSYQHQICIGTIHGEQPTDSEPKLLPLLIDLNAGSCFSQLLDAVQEKMQDALAHGSLPLSCMLDLAKEQREPSPLPAFQALLTMQEPTLSNGLSQFVLKSHETASQMIQFDLHLSIVEAEGALEGTLAYCSDLFESDYMKRFLEHFKCLLKEMVRQPKALLNDLSFVSEDERRQLLEDRIQRVQHFPGEVSVHQWVMRIAEQMPRALAIECGEQTFDYASLISQARIMAAALMPYLRGPDDVVAIYARRSPALIATALGINLAGAAWLPIDPDAPQDRVDFMLQDSGALVVVYGDQNHPPQTELPVLCPQELGAPDTLAPYFPSRSQNLAYVIYTSGSTGRPKGVAITQYSFLNMVASWCGYYGFQPGDRGSQLANVAFDASVFEIWPLLVSGGTIVQAPSEVVAEPEPLRDWIIEQQLRHVFVPTPMGELLIACSWPQDVALENMMVGGDKLHAYPSQPLPFRLFNNYGPTENTVVASVEPLPEEHPGGHRPPPIGAPFPGTNHYVLDPSLQVVPLGVSGELFLSGNQLARGYLGRPQLTASRFLPDPFSSEPGARMYRTGDLVSLRQVVDAPATLDFLGRTDFQVKLRGYRIELGEIENALKAHSHVTSAAVLLHTASNGYKQLVACVVPAQGCDVDTQSLKTYLGEFLMDYMVPSNFTVLEAMPLTSAGKLDRLALLAMVSNSQNTTSEARSQETAITEPVSDLEIRMAEIWKDIFALETIGMEANFFDLGGHSLLAIRLADRVNREFQVNLSIRDYLEKPTVAGFVSCLENASTETEEKEALNMEDEVQLDRTVWPGLEIADFVDQPKAVFLTGATGFVGAFLLDSLLRQTPAHVYCLVRCDDPTHGLKRIQANLNQYGLRCDLSRVRAVPGDLSKPSMGIDPERFQELGDKVEAIYHNGALVHFLYPYSSLKAANVYGVQEALRLAVTGRLKPFHYLSTVAVFRSSTTYRQGVMYEDDPLDNWSRLNEGYVQSKWVGDKVTRMAEARGVPVGIYRIGRVTGHRETGACDEGSMLMRVIRGYVQLGAAPYNDDLVDMIPVDYLCDALVHLSRQEDSVGLAFTLENPVKIKHNDLVSWLNRFGYPVETLPYPQWHKRLGDALARGEDNALRPLFSTYVDASTVEQQTSGVSKLISRFAFKKSSQKNQVICDQSNVTNGLADSDIQCPAIDDQLLETYVRYLVEKGHLPERS